MYNFSFKCVFVCIEINPYEPCTAPRCVDCWQGARCFCGGFKSVIGPFNQSESVLSRGPAPTDSRATEPLPWVSHYRPSLSRGILSLSEPSQSASQHRAVAEKHNLQVAPLYTTQWLEAYCWVTAALLNSFQGNNADNQATSEILHLNFVST